MEAAVKTMEAQLKLWGLKIDRLATKTQAVGVQARFDALMYVDELKALRAIAQSKLDEFRAAGGAEQARLKVELKSAWDELDAAFENPKPPPSAVGSQVRGGSRIRRVRGDTDHSTSMRGHSPRSIPEREDTYHETTSSQHRHPDRRPGRDRHGDHPGLPTE